MQLYQSFFQQKFTPTTAVGQMFDDQKAATTFSGVGLALRYKTTPPKFKWGAASIPKGQTLFNHTSGDSPIVWAKSKYPAESAALLAFLTNDAGRISYHKVRGQTPSRVSLFDKVGYDSPEGKLSLELTRVGYAPPITPGYLEYFNAMNAAVKDIALGAAVEDRLHKVAKEIDGLLAPYRK
jgi:multiple sugar transport system substrate-binding protein